MATRKRDRFIALFFAVLFLGTSSALAVTVLVSNLQNNKQDPGASSSQSNKNMLAGTKLANFTPVASVPELSFTDTVVGTGEAAKSTDTVTLDYTGALASTGVIFESSKDSGQPLSRPINTLVPGMTQGITGMKVGGTRRIVIPSALGYGAGASEKVPANSDLVFDVTAYAISK